VFFFLHVANWFLKKKRFFASISHQTIRPCCSFSIFDF
jgi:hypothetical protein